MSLIVCLFGFFFCIVLYFISWKAISRAVWYFTYFHMSKVSHWEPQNLGEAMLLCFFILPVFLCWDLSICLVHRLTTVMSELVLGTSLLLSMGFGRSGCLEVLNTFLLSFAIKFSCCFTDGNLYIWTQWHRIESCVEAWDYFISCGCHKSRVLLGHQTDA